MTSAVRVAMLVSRIRVEEKLLLTALEAAGADVRLLDDGALVFAVEQPRRGLDVDVVLERSVSTARGSAVRLTSMTMRMPWRSDSSRRSLIMSSLPSRTNSAMRSISVAALL